MVGVIVVLISIALIFFMSQKKNGGESRPQGLTGPTMVQQTPRYLSATEARAWTTSVNNRITSLEEQMKTWAYRTWLLAVISNENTNDRFNQKRTGMILDEQWKVNRTPETMKLNEEQLRELKQSLK